MSKDPTKKNQPKFGVTENSPVPLGNPAPPRKHYLKRARPKLARENAAATEEADGGPKFSRARKSLLDHLQFGNLAEKLAGTDGENGLPQPSRARQKGRLGGKAEGKPTLPARTSLLDHLPYGNVSERLAGTGGGNNVAQESAAEGAENEGGLPGPQYLLLTRSKMTLGQFSNRSPPSEALTEARFQLTETFARCSDRLDYFFRVLRYSMGYGTIWRFPYMCYKYGGSFLLCYLILFPTMVLPIYMMDHILGQYAGLVPISAFKHMCPAFQGLGVAMSAVAAVLAVYYNIISSWIFVYVIQSFRRDPPWDTCNRTQAGLRTGTADCWDPALNQACSHVKRGRYVIWWNKDCRTAAEFCSANVNVCKNGKKCTRMSMLPLNSSHCLNASAVMVNNKDETMLHVPLSKAIRWSMSQDDYFRRSLLNVQNRTTWENMGSVNLGIAMGLCAAWIIILVAHVFNIPRRLGKLTYLSTLLAVSVFVFTGLYSLSLTGADIGIKALFRVRADLLKDPQMWLDCAGETIILFGIGTTGAFALASKRLFFNNCIKEAMISGLVTFLMPLFPTFMAYSVAGWTAGQTGRSVEEAVLTPVGISFIAASTLTSASSLPLFYSVLLFLSYLMLGFTTTYSFLDTLLRELLNMRVDIRSRVSVIVFALCSTCFLLGLPFCLNGGIFLLIIIDSYLPLAVATPALLLEVIVVVYIYGIGLVFYNLLEMLGSVKGAVSVYLLATWVITAPTFLGAMLVLQFVFPAVEKFTYYAFPPVTLVAHQILFGGFLLCIVLGFLCAWVTASKKGDTRLSKQQQRHGSTGQTSTSDEIAEPTIASTRRLMFTPSSEWCPSYKRDWIMPPFPRRRRSPQGKAAPVPTADEDEVRWPYKHDKGIQVAQAGSTEPSTLRDTQDMENRDSRPRTGLSKDGISSSSEASRTPSTSSEELEDRGMRRARRSRTPIP